MKLTGEVILCTEHQKNDMEQWLITGAAEAG